MTKTLEMPETIINGAQKKRVAVAMSGGVDSSVAAALLVEAGYEVVGLMMRLWSEAEKAAGRYNRCCTPDQMADARRVAEMLNIPFYVLDVQDYFRRTIVQFFIDEHGRGRTPNPCIECNRQIRFSFLLKHALALDVDYLATGHYARLRHKNGRIQLLRATDAQKDQSYVLHVLNQQQLGQSLFPIGEYTKDEVRQLASRFNLPVASKQESQDLCFVTDGNYRRFLEEHAPEVSTPGPIRDLNGLEIGRHNGLPHYTIGQRKGLGLSSSQPLFVIDKDVAGNALVVASRESLGRQSVVVREVNWLSGDGLHESTLEVEVKIRYKAKPLPATIMELSNNRVRVQFDEPAIGVTPGQGAVFYDGPICIGGGLIDDSSPAVEAGHSHDSVLWLMQ